MLAYYLPFRFFSCRYTSHLIIGHRLFNNWLLHLIIGRSLFSVHPSFSNSWWIIRSSVICAVQIYWCLQCIYSVLLLFSWLGLEAHVHVHTLQSNTCTRIHMPNARVGNCQPLVFHCRSVSFCRLCFSLASSLSPRVRMCAHTALRRAARVHARVLLCLAKPLVWVSVANEY